MIARSATDSWNRFNDLDLLLNKNIISGNGEARMPAGFHRYSFNFTLPYNIPCSFEHTNGHIRYTMKAVIDRPWKFNHESKIAFTVVSSYDLNSRSHQCVSEIATRKSVFLLSYIKQKKIIEPKWRYRATTSSNQNRMMIFFIRSAQMTKWIKVSVVSAVSTWARWRYVSEYRRRGSYRDNRWRLWSTSIIPAVSTWRRSALNWNE